VALATETRVQQMAFFAKATLAQPAELAPHAEAEPRLALAMPAAQVRPAADARIRHYECM
jgi:hypothetical protein